MTFAVAPCFGSEMVAYVPTFALAPAELARRSPRRSGWSGRWSALCAVQPQEGKRSDVEDIPDLYRVTPAPTYEEMLAWAEQTDKRVATGRLPPLGSRPPPSAAEAVEVADGSLLSDQEQAQMETLSGLLSKRRREGSLLTEQEEASLRAAVVGLSASVDNVGDEIFDGTASSPDSGDGRAETDDLVRNQIYGSREVRDKVYLYAWSLMKNRQEEAERTTKEQERQRRR